MLQKLLIQKLAERLFSGELKGVHIDSRLVGRGDLFVAFPGENSHGNRFIEKVMKKKGVEVVAHKAEPHPEGDNIHPVRDPESFLRSLARALRSMSEAKFVAITGSNGKTTTKDLLHLALGGGPSLLKTRGNYNNHIGVPLTLCHLKDHHKVAIVEAGMSEPGEIASLTSLIRPNVSILTSINRAHLKGLGSLKAIAKEKADIFAKAPKATCLVREEDLKFSEVRKALGDRNPIIFNLDHEAKPFEGKMLSKGVKWSYGELKFLLPSPALHNVDNAMAAVRVVEEFGGKIEQLPERLEKWKPSDHRLCLLNWKKRKILDDCYNANPASLLSALKTATHLRKRDDQKLFVLLGDMKELGSRSRALHRECGREMARLGVDVLLGVGDHSQEALRAFAEAGGENFRNCPSTEEMADCIKTLSRPHDILLLKGSRSMKLETVLKELHQNQPNSELAAG
jgi:UDP-N-acetylmuramoyl-tripeptide--D-alanyl-D-alanine ligase